MKITNIKSTKSLEFLRAKLEYKLTKAGYNINISIVNKSRIDILGPHRGKGPQMRAQTFAVNISCFRKGYRRSHKPTWSQYEDLNHIINDLLDLYKVSATIKSLDFKVRDKEYGRVNNWNQPSWVWENQTKGYGPVFDTELGATSYVLSFRRKAA